jgi:hypothetical protein
MGLTVAPGSSSQSGVSSWLCWKQLRFVVVSPKTALKNGSAGFLGLKYKAEQHPLELEVITFSRLVMR